VQGGVRQMESKGPGARGGPGCIETLYRGRACAAWPTANERRKRGGVGWERDPRERRREPMDGSTRGTDEARWDGRGGWSQWMEEAEMRRDEMAEETERQRLKEGVSVGFVRRI
jgi:hypothetical protein